LLSLLLAGSTLAGSYGVSDGGINGVVLADDGSPLGDVFVVAQRTEGNPPVIRSTRTDAQGRFYLRTPVGAYLLGFSRFGFQTIQTAEGEQNQRTALGAQVRTFVEPGQTAQIQDIRLRPNPSQGSSSITLNLLDAITGDPISNATVIVGSSVSSGDGNRSGSYRLQVVPNLGEDGTTPQPLPVIVQADGFRPFQGQAVVVGGVDQALSFSVQPLLVVLSGVLSLDSGIPSERIPDIQVVVDGVPQEFSQGTVQAGGYFEVLVPASNSSLRRTFNLSFLLEGASIASIPGVEAPRGGSRNLGQGVRMESIKTEISGNVVSSDGSLPQGGRITQAVIVELGLSVPIQGGSFHLPGIPIGRPLTLQVSVENPTTGRIEVAETTFTATAGGNFSIPPIITTPVGR
jgi:hypothetical protein